MLSLVYRRDGSLSTSELLAVQQLPLPDHETRTYTLKIADKEGKVMRGSVTHTFMSRSLAWDVGT